jgi:hypothetical protein
MGVIIALTLKEAMRRRAFLGTLIILVTLYGLSFLPRAFKEAFGGDERQFELGVNIAVLFGIDAIKFFSAVLAILLSAGAITAEIERGYLAAILPRPLYRWELYLGKWLGVMLFSAANATLWTAMLWVSVALQGEPRVEMWQRVALCAAVPNPVRHARACALQFSGRVDCLDVHRCAGRVRLLLRPFPAPDSRVF